VAGNVLRSGHVNYWTGTHGREFEQEFAAWVGAPFGVAVANGTLALEIALASLGIGPGDEVIVPAATFIATASAVAGRGAVPVVVDVDRERQSLTADGVAAALTTRTRAVVIVHLAGVPAEIEPVLRLARTHGLYVVEDCAQAHGARSGGQGVGTFGDIAAWSFCQDKIMTTAGEGGAVTTADRRLWQRCWELKDHGKSYSAVHEQNPAPGFRWLHDRFGTNARLTEVQAAVGRRQLGKVDGWVQRRRGHAAALRAALLEVPGLRLPPHAPGIEPSWYRFYLHVRPELLSSGWHRDRIVQAIVAEGVPCSFGGCTEIHREGAFRRIGAAVPALPIAGELGRTSLALLVHPTLEEEDIADTATAVRKVMNTAASSGS
jgi:dTDP-4-amino-4,6-dideoxygalactose transaminase